MRLLANFKTLSAMTVAVAGFGSRLDAGAIGLARWRRPLLRGGKKALLFLVLALPAWSGTIFSSFGPGYTWSNSAVSIGGGNGSFGMRFVPSATGSLTSILLPLNGVSSPDANLVVSLFAPGTLPTGTAIESWSLPPAAIASGPDVSIVTLNSVINPTLIAGNAYWLYAESASTNGSYYDWFLSSTLNAREEHYVPGSHPVWIAYPDGSALVFQVDESTGVPEPATISLSGLALGVAFLLRGQWRNNKRLHGQPSEPLT